MTQNAAKMDPDSTTEDVQKPMSEELNITAGMRVMLVDLNERYPAFRDMLPLAVGTHLELAEAGYENAVLRKLMYQHVHSSRYLKRVAKGGHRYHLDGTQAEPLEQLHVDNAKAIVKERAKQFSEMKRRQKVLQAEHEARRVAKAERMAKLEAKKAKKTSPSSETIAAVNSLVAVKKAPKPIPATSWSAPEATKPLLTVPVVVKRKRIVLVPK